MIRKEQATAHKRYYGFLESSIKLMMKYIRRAYRKNKKSKGGQYKHGPEKMLDVFLRRVRYKDTFRRISHDTKISLSTVFNIYQTVVKILGSASEFFIKGLSELKPGSYIIDTTPIILCRSKDYETRKLTYNNKYKKHCAKLQVIILEGSTTIENVYLEFHGAKHDFSILKSLLDEIPEGVTFIADSGYQGIEKLIPGSKSPRKKPHKKERPEEDKVANNQLAIIRIPIEHVNSFLKRFKIIGGTYRGTDSNLEKVVMLLCGICRYELLQMSFCLLLFIEHV